MTSDIERIINYSKYPITEPNSAILVEVIKLARHELNEKGIALLPDFMLSSALKETITDTEQVLPKAFRGISDHNVYLEDCKEEKLEPNRPSKIISPISGEDKTWTRGPWTPTLDRVHGPPVMDQVHGQFFLIMRNEQK